MYPPERPVRVVQRWALVMKSGLTEQIAAHDKREMLLAERIQQVDGRNQQVQFESEKYPSQLHF